MSTIAIDFGTSRTKLAYLDKTTGRPELMRLGQRDDPFIPSLFYLERNSERVFLGDDAEAMLTQDPAGVVDVLKRKLDDTHVRANRRRITPLELLTRLFAELRTRVSREVTVFNGQLATSASLTMPAIYGPSQERLLREAAEQAGFTDIVLVPEPVAAARAWLAQVSNDTPGVVVFDGGGGTSDWAYLRRDGADFRLVPECPPGGDRVGGHDLDRELLARVLDQLDDAAPTWQGNQPAALQRIRVMKEHYCRGLPLQPVKIGGHQVMLSPSDIESVFAARFIRHACEGLKGYLTQVHAVSGSDQPPVLLVGGSARLKGLREAIERECDCETLWWERADYATVLGAVQGHQESSPVAATFLPSDDMARDIAEEIEAYRISGDDDEAIVKKHAAKRIETWRVAAEADLPSAQWLLGNCYFWGAGVTQDDAQAVAWYRKAAEQGYARAQFMLGIIYENAIGVTKNETQAVAWYRKAAEQGDADAQFMLGEMYSDGQGVTQDDAQAVAWYRKAAEQGHKEAQQKLDGGASALATITAIGGALLGAMFSS